jgi:FAD/FMN-containing dehydrogenase
MSPHATGGVYVNLLGGDEPDRARSAYGSNYDRLRDLKRKYDPGNFFRMNHNVDPG